MLSNAFSYHLLMRIFETPLIGRHRHPGLVELRHIAFRELSPIEVLLCFFEPHLPVLSVDSCQGVVLDLAVLLVELIIHDIELILSHLRLIGVLVAWNEQVTPLLGRGLSTHKRVCV